MLDFEEKALCRKVAGVFELSAINGYEPFNFISTWLNSDTAMKLYQWDFKDIAQSKQYLLHSIEFEENLYENEEKRNKEDKTTKAMYWFGYIIMYLSLDTKISPKEIISTYDVVKIYMCYETLHSLSSKNAVEEIEKNFHRLKANSKVH